MVSIVLIDAMEWLRINSFGINACVEQHTNIDIQQCSKQSFEHLISSIYSCKSSAVRQDAAQRHALQLVIHAFTD